MVTAKLLQKHKILGLDGAVIRIQHPEVENYVVTPLGAQIAAAGTEMTVLDNTGASPTNLASALLQLEIEWIETISA